VPGDARRDPIKRKLDMGLAVETGVLAFLIVNDPEGAHTAIL